MTAEGTRLPGPPGATQEDASAAKVVLTFAELFRNELRYVWNSLRRQGVPERDLEDVVHEVFLVVHRRLHEFDSERELRPWLFGIAFRCAIAYRRRSSHRFEELQNDADDDLQPDPAALADAKLELCEDRAMIWRALDSLPIGRRAVVILHDFDEVPIPQVALALEVPLRTAYSRLRVGREELVAALRRLKLKEGSP